jgi:hypothetical protein
MTQRQQAQHVPSLARGRVISGGGDGVVVFNPTGPNYQWNLVVTGRRVQPPSAGSNEVEARIHVKGRKLWTVPSGGTFVTPIAGPPRIVQGRVRHADGGTLLVQAGTLIHVELPRAASAFDLASGPIVVGGLVNISCEPGATIELLESAASAL